MFEEFQPYEAADREIVEVCRDLKVLSLIAWPKELADTFLKGWEAGDPKIPKPPKVAMDLDPQIAALERLSTPIDDHPIALFLARTARSYLLTARMLEASGTPAFTDLSVAIYGRPTDVVAPGGLTNINAAEALLEASDDLAQACAPDEGDYCVLPETVKNQMLAAFATVFDDEPLDVVIDPGLASKAAAGAGAVRIRGGTCFSDNDLQQLIHHEGFVHSATARNGRKQPRLTSLGLGAPRTTSTQEGLATFAEFITSSIDLNRLRRLALRIKGIHMALEGADFIEVFKFFLESGQTEKESYFSAARVFRGGDPKGGVAFTKDVVYLRGLLRTQTFLLAALEQRKVQYVQYLFSGRLTWGDVVALEPFFESGLIAPARYAPEWVRRKDCIAAHLAISNLTHKLPMEKAQLSDFDPPGVNREGQD